MTELYDPELSQTMVYCDNPLDCDYSIMMGREKQMFFMRYMDREMDFCSVDCLFDWIMEQPIGEDYESD